MEDVNNLPGEFYKPLKQCLDLLNFCNITVFDKGNIFFKYLRYAYVVSCVLVFHTSQGVYLQKAFKGELQLFELVYIVPIYVVCTQIFYWMNILGSWQYMLAPIVETLFWRYILKKESDFLLPFSCSFPFDPTGNWLTYVLTYLLQVYSMCLIIYCYLGSEFLMITLCALLSIEFTLLGEELLHIEPEHYKNRNYDITEVPNKHYTRTLKDVVQRHQKLIRLTEQLDDIFNKMIFFNLSSATIVIGFFGFSARVAHGALYMANNLIGSIASVLPIFNLCYYAELLRETSSAISDSAYNSLWYKGNNCYQKSILIILRRSQNPCFMTSMKYNPIALNTFTAVLSTTWSYFSLVSNLYEN